MDFNQLLEEFKKKVDEFKRYLERMPKDELYSYIAIFIGIVLVILAFVIG